jgi:7,8-dihydropterin-6-yl-methyl-4-(beta-D-ribofuranosyl)aminobenzene 5'-phosphate synthase
MDAHHVAVTILVDNQAGPGLTTEHGLALWIEAEGQHILFDTGQGPALPVNAQALGIDLGQTKRLVLSHGHYDHTGGIPHVLNSSPHVHVYCHPGVVQPRYSRRNGSPKPIQMPPPAMTALDRIDDKNLHWTSESLRLSANIGLTGPIPRETRYEDTGGPFFRDRATRTADPIDDDLALWIRTAKGLVVCVGCCHAGLINTLNHVRRLSGTARIRAVIGGFHLLNASPRRLEQTLAALATLAMDRIIPCHCTGSQAIDAMEALLGQRVVRGQSGLTFHF